MPVVNVVCTLQDELIRR